MRHQVQCRPVHLPRAYRIFRGKLFVRCVPYPQIDVPPPVLLRRGRRHMRYGSFVHLSYTLYIRVLLLQLHIIKPRIVLTWVCGNSLGVLKPPFADNHLLYSLRTAVLLFKLYEPIVQTISLTPRQHVQRVLVYPTRPVVLSRHLFEFRKVDEQFLRHRILPQSFECRFVHSP